MRGRQTLLISVVAMALGQGGCIYSSQVKKTPLKPPDSYAAAAGKRSGEAQNPGRWWRLFKDPQLNKLVVRALRHNLDLEQARARLDNARASVTLATAGYYPRVSAKADASVSQSTVELPTLTGGTSEKTQTRESYSMSLGVSYEVDLWGKVRFGRKAAQADLAATAQDLHAARISVAAQLADAYFLAIELRAQLKLLDSTIKNRAANLRLVQRRYREGVVTALDIYQAQESLARSQAQRTTFVRRLRTTEHAVALLVGSFPRGGLTGTLEQLPPAVAALPTGLPAQLLRRRPDIISAHARLVAADARVGQAVAGHYPSLSINASVGMSFDPLGLIWSLLGNITAPIFEGLRVKAQVQQREALLRQQLALYKATLLRALKEVEDALVSGQTLERRVRFLEQRVAAADSARRLSTEQYMQGLVNYLVVLTTEQSVYSARAELITARRELISSRIQLARALAGGWADNKGRADDAG